MIHQLILEVLHLFFSKLDLNVQTVWLMLATQLIILLRQNNISFLFPLFDENYQLDLHLYLSNTDILNPNGSSLIWLFFVSVLQ